MAFLKSLYVFSIALLVLAVVVFGIAAFPTPQAPEVSPELQSIGQYPTDEEQQLLDEQSQNQQTFQDKLSLYSQLVSFAAIGVAIVLLIGSILWLRGVPIIGEGVTLGAVFTLLYSLIQAYFLGAGLLTFLAVIVGLVILLGLIYWKFVRSKDAPGWSPEQGQQTNPQQAESDPAGIAGRKG